MLVTTIALAASLATSPAPSKVQTRLASPQIQTAHRFAVTLHSMTEEDKRMYPGRENWDKTEWYEAQFKSAKVVLLPEHVDEWNNGGLDLT